MNIIVTFQGLIIDDNPTFLNRMVDGIDSIVASKKKKQDYFMNPFMYMVLHVLHRCCYCQWLWSIHMYLQ